MGGTSHGIFFATWSNRQGGRGKIDIGVAGSNYKMKLDKTVNRMEVVNSKLAEKKQGIDVLERKVNVQQKVIERGEVNYNDRVEDCRLLKLEIKRLKEEANFLEQDTRNLTSLKKEVLKLERELMQQKSRNKVLQTELENPLNVHRWRRLEGKDPETLELIQKINQLQKRLISKQEDLIDKDMKIEEIQKLYNEAKIQLSRQPKYDIHVEIRNLKDELKRRHDKIIVLSTESNMYQIETSKAKKIIEGMNEELNMVGQALTDDDESVLFHDCTYLDEAEVFGGKETGEQIPRDHRKT